MKFKRLPDEFKDLEIGLKRLSFIDNFRSFQTTVTIPATSEIEIKNLISPSIPSQRIILRQTGNGVITDGPSRWDEENVYLYNNGAVPVTATVIFLE